MTDWQLRPVTPADHEAIALVNAANEPEVGPLDEDRITLFAAAAHSFTVAEVDGAVVGLFVGLTEAVAYASPNYQWFSERHDRFVYVDRIALQPELRGLGVADALYASFEGWALASGRPVVCAEVNVVPPNPRSMRFHERRGFVAVGEVSPYGGRERVAMVEKTLSPRSS